MQLSGIPLEPRRGDQLFIISEHIYQFRFQVKDVPEETLTAGDAALQSSLVERARGTVMGLGTGGRMTVTGDAGEI